MQHKAGIRTSEFWLALAPWVLALFSLALLGMGRLDPDAAMAIIGALGLGGGYLGGKYAESRGRVKTLNGK